MKKHILTLFLLPTVLFFAACNSHSGAFLLNYADEGREEVEQGGEPKDRKEDSKAGDKQEPTKQKTYRKSKKPIRRPAIRTTIINGVSCGGDEEDSDSEEDSSSEEDADE